MTLRYNVVVDATRLCFYCMSGKPPSSLNHEWFGDADAFVGVEDLLNQAAKLNNLIEIILEKHIASNATMHFLLSYFASVFKREKNWQCSSAVE